MIPVILLIFALVFANVNVVDAAPGDLVIKVVAAPNLVVDSNALSPSTYAPQVATVIGEFCNVSANTIDEVTGYIGDGLNPGTYSATAPNFTITDGSVSTTYRDSLSFKHLGGAADATRYMGTLQPGECAYQYWSFEYPQTTFDSGDNEIPTWGTSVKSGDDLYLSFNIWGTSAANLTAETTTPAQTTMYFRNEISAMANKIKPNGNPAGQWFNTDTSTIYPGETIVTNGVLYRIGNVNQGFDNDNDGLPDYNAWLQPFGNPAYDPSCFRLVGSSGTLTVTRQGGAETIINFSDQLYFTNLPTDNTNVRGVVYYEFLALGGACTIPISPYQEVASGSDNEKFNGDYGTGIPSLKTYEPEVILSKTAPNTADVNTTLTYRIDFENQSSQATAGLTLSSGGVNAGLMISDTIPAGLVYIAGSAADAIPLSDNNIPANNNVTIRYYDASNSMWTTTEPAAADVGAIQWWLDEPLNTNGSGENSGYVRFQATIPSDYLVAPTNGSPIIENCSTAGFGEAAPFAEACDTTLVNGTFQIGNYIWKDENRDGLQTGEDTAASYAIDGATVYLYFDKNQDGILDDTDPLVKTATSSFVANGDNYALTNLPAAMYIVKVENNDSALPDGYQSTTKTEVAVNLTANDLTVDFGFGPTLTLQKTRISPSPANPFDTVSFQIDLTNLLAGSGSPNRSCQYKVWGPTLDQNYSGRTDGSVSPGAPGTDALFPDTNGFGYPDGSYAQAELGNNTEQLAVTGFAAADPGQSITKVEVLMPIEVEGTIGTNPELTLEVIDSTTGTAVHQLVIDEVMSGYVDGVRTYTVFQASPSVNPGSVFADWAAYDGSSYSIMVNVKGASDGSFGVDTLGFRITTDGICGDASTDITYLPVTDTYDSTELEFLSASISPSSVIPGTITWDNLGTLYAGGTRTVTVNFKALRAANPSTNTASISNTPKFGDGKSVNIPPDDTADVVIDMKGSIGDAVWYDLNGNGTQEVGEPGIAGVEVRLCSNAGCSGGNNDLYGTLTTDADGYYRFTGLDSDTYYVVLTTGAGTSLDGFSNTADPDNTAPANESIVTLTLNGNPTNDNNDVQDFGYDNGSNGSVNGYVWRDDNSNGVIDNGEDKFGGETVRLCTGTPPTCTELDSTTTDSNGYYQFNAVPASTGYFIQVVGSPDTVQTYEDGIGLCAVVTCNGSSAPFDVTADTVSPDHNFGYRASTTSSIGDTIFRDWNGDAIQDTGEEGIDGLTVKLYKDQNNDGVVDNDDLLVETTVTIGGGMYQFDDVVPGDYLVVVTPPADHVQTLDPDESGVCGVCDSQSVQLGVDGTNDYLTHDYAYQPKGTGSIGDYVWHDANGDGIQDADEDGIPGITVNLYQDQDGNGSYDPVVDAFVGTATTDADGNYEFSGLSAGNFVVVVDGNHSEMPTDGNGVPYAPTTSTTDGVSLSAGQVYVDADFGFAPNSSIGDFIWQDDNGNGYWESTEAGINGVVVELYEDTNKDGSPDGLPIATTITADKNGEPGYYLFTGLGAGEYVVKVADSNFTGGGVLVNYSQTGDPDADSEPCSGTGLNGCNDEYSLNEYTSPADGAVFPGLELGQNNMSADFGYQPNGAYVGDTIWIDTNNDGIKDSNESGIPDITVRLCNTTACDDQVITTTTDENGQYSFSGIGDGTYYVVVDNTNIPTGLSQTYERDGSTDENTEITIASGDVTEIGGVACAGICRLDVDFGYRYEGDNSIVGTAWHDDNNGGQTDGIGDINNPPEDKFYKDVPVFLYRCVNGCGGSDDVYVGTTLTDDNGDYSFAQLADGDYRVIVDDDALSVAGTSLSGSGANTVPKEYSNINLPGNTTERRDFGFLSNLDLGDLPPGYQATNLDDNGARHVVSTNLYLGAVAEPDKEANGIETGTANGDDQTGVDDEDGIARMTSSGDNLGHGGWTNGPVNTGDGGSLEITVSGIWSGIPQVFIDFNGDDTLTEVVLRDALGNPMTGRFSPSATPYRVYFDIPDNTFNGADSSSLFVRVRLSANGGLGAFGLASEGEVEDYMYNFGPTAVTLNQFSANGNIADPVGLVVVLSLVLVAGSFIIIRRRKVIE